MNRLTFITGPPGCGKSTLVNYGNSKSGQFQEKWIDWDRISMHLTDPGKVKKARYEWFAPPSVVKIGIDLRAHGDIFIMGISSNMHSITPLFEHVGARLIALLPSREVIERNLKIRDAERGRNELKGYLLAYESYVQNIGKRQWSAFKILEFDIEFKVESLYKQLKEEGR